MKKTTTTFYRFPDTISKLESKRLSDEEFLPHFTTSKSLSPKLEWYNYKIKLKFEGSCFKQEDNAAFTPKNVVNCFIVYELGVWLRDLNTDFTLGVACFEVLLN